MLQHTFRSQMRLHLHPPTRARRGGGGGGGGVRVSE